MTRGNEVGNVLRVDMEGESIILKDTQENCLKIWMVRESTGKVVRSERSARVKDGIPQADLVERLEV
jgi:frataxin-like iron-binding protein CyaY